MSQNESKMISEREAVLREREAAGRAIRELSERARHTLASVLPYDWRGIDAFAAELYPLPKVTRPRVVADPMRKGFEFRAIDGRIESRQAAGECATQWTPFEELELTANRIALWADLIANPREEVDADA